MGHLSAVQLTPYSRRLETALTADIQGNHKYFIPHNMNYHTYAGFFIMPLFPYNRAAAVAYARKWAMSRNPNYYDYEKLGGDCTNFVSQCLYAGGGVMNYKPTFGWYYTSANNHSPSWTGVPYLYNFLTRKTGIGPIGMKVDMDKIQPGDVSQFWDGKAWYHSQIITSIGNPPSPGNILICTHTFDSIDRPLTSYENKGIRFIHIDGVIR